jgi:RNA polymerase primary sigma factor
MKDLTFSKRLTNRDTQSFNQYLKEIGDIDLLSPEEEKALTKRTSEGDEAAITELVRKNLRFVVSVAKQYASAANPLPDLINEGNIGLIIAARKFKPEMGFKFISYGVWWIRKVILEFINKNSRLVRLPDNKIGLLNKLEKKITKLEQELGRKVDVNDLIDVDFGGILLTDSYKINDEYQLLTMLNNNVDSIDREIDTDDGNGTTLGELLTSESIFKASDYELVKNETNDKLISVINLLKPREQHVINGLFGLDGSFPRTLRDIGDELDITREMVRQIRDKSLTKMKNKLTKVQQI